MGFTLIQPSDIGDMHAHLTLLMDQYEIELPQFAGFDLSRLESEWIRLRSNIPEPWKFNNDGREFLVGQTMKDRGLDAKFPVVLIPGVISTVSELLCTSNFLKFCLKSLESWSTTPDNRPFVRPCKYVLINFDASFAVSRETLGWF